MIDRRIFALATFFSVSACSGSDTPVDGGALDASIADAAHGLDAFAIDAYVATDVGHDAPNDVGMDSPDGGHPFDAACLPMLLAAAPGGTFAIPTSSGTEGSSSFTICPDGSSATATPPICTGETTLGSATLTPTVTATSVTLTGTVPFRVEDASVQVALGICSPTVTVSINQDGSCPGGAYEPLPVSIVIAIHASNALTVDMVLDESAVDSNLASDRHLCGVAACDALCCIMNPCACALAGIADWSPVENAVVTSTVSALRTSLLAQIEAQICVTNVDGPCPTGTTADAAGVCRNADMSCPPAYGTYSVCDASHG